MKRRDFEGMCGSAAEGHVKWVENKNNNLDGLVCSCSEKGIEVEIQGSKKHETWSPEECEERTYGYKPPYG